MFKAAQKAQAVANIGINYADEVQGCWTTAATMKHIAEPLCGLGMRVGGNG